MIRRVLAAVAAFALLAGCSLAPAPVRQAAPEPAELAVISAMHGYHRDHPGYDYDDLYALVGAFDPDRVGVEIRAEDMDRSPEYLAANYPAEMIALAGAYGERAFGVDWLGTELEGRAVPSGWWREQSEIKALERAMSSDPGFADPETAAFGEQQLKILRGATPESLHDGRYDAVSRAKYAHLRSRLAGTPYEALARFYDARDARIAEAIWAEALRHPGRRMVAVVGADHRAAVIDLLSDDPRIRLLDIPPPGQGPVHAGSLSPLLEEAGVEGAVLVRRVSDGAEWTGGGVRIEERFLPASTFKIPNSLIILQSGAVSDVDADLLD